MLGAVVKPRLMFQAWQFVVVGFCDWERGLFLDHVMGLAILLLLLSGGRGYSWARVDVVAWWVIIIEVL